MFYLCKHILVHAHLLFLFSLCFSNHNDAIPDCNNKKNEAEQTLDTVIPWPCTEECFVNVLWILNVLWMFSEFCIYIEHIFQSLESSWEHPLRNTVRDNIPRVTLGTSQVLSRRTRERPPVRSWTPLQNPLPFGLPTLQTFRHFWIFMRGSS